MKRPNSIADRLCLLGSAQGGWRQRVQEKDMSKFTVEGKLSSSVGTSFRRRSSVNRSLRPVVGQRGFVCHVISLSQPPPPSLLSINISMMHKLLQLNFNSMMCRFPGYFAKTLFTFHASQTLHRNCIHVACIRARNVHLQLRRSTQ